MLGHFGFSYVGLLYLLMLFIPNIIWSRAKPEGYDPGEESKPLLLFERTGQMFATASALLFRDYDQEEISVWTVWLAASFLMLLLYEACWVRYFRNGRKIGDFYRRFLGVPVPLASLPVCAFFLLGVYGKVIWMMGSAVILGIGHIGIHLQHRKKHGIK